ncbi:carboxylesterase family protein [Sphingomonas hengshuiensis]|uniref:carboxylesterase family protein n=1 Tax=Sphingomonas hengshuiensis TaxID=1609977 RepID=UPI00138DEA1B|nr:alpha/beta hydrolase-fold protein [Sphingomonas hengshuiensis]
MFASALLALAGCATTPHSPATGDRSLSYAMPQAGGKQIPYRVYLPSAWSPRARMPLVVVLHGYAATADQPFEEAAGKLQREAERHGFVVVSPSGYNGMADYGANLPLPSSLSRSGKPLDTTPQAESALAEADVLNVIDRATRDYAIDSRRIYLMGNSMGMTGVLHLARTQPQRWCAVSASGGPPWPDYPVERLKRLSGMLLVHGGRDTLAKIADSEGLANRAKAAGIDARLQVIPEGTHGDAWTHYLAETFQFFADRDCRNR